ncbi:MAG: UPF0149 family protein [Candidatus Obscuribacterales bacterium]|nr:UPF0149 family protein [Steroidobacteraceae bacterium]
MFSITFTQAADTLSAAQCVVSGAEAHGCLCGTICVSEQYPLQSWIDEVLPDDVEIDIETEQSFRKTLQLLHQDTVRTLLGDDMEFSPLLPDDDAPLAARATALAQWCQGFLYGFGLATAPARSRVHPGELPQAKELPEEVDEVLRDFAQIARASPGESEPTEEDEVDYAELVEYIRVSVHLVHYEMQKSSRTPEAIANRH